jgi:hypothetical protein
MTKVFLELLKLGGPLWLLVAVVIAALSVAIWKLWKELGKERERSIGMVTEHHETHKNVAKEMFEVINKNTEAFTRNAESSKDLKDSMRDLRNTLAIHK